MRSRQPSQILITGGSADATLTTTVSTNQDFSFTSDGLTDQTVIPGQIAGFTFGLTPLVGAHVQPVTFTVTGMAAGAVVTFRPSTVTSGTKQVVMTAVVPATTLTAINQSLQNQHVPGPPTAALAILLAPFVFRRRLLLKGTQMPPTILLVLTIVTGALFITGCGAGLLSPPSKT